MTQDIQSIFRGLADPTRRELVGLLGNQVFSISSLAANFDCSRNAIVKHLKVLKEGGIVGSYVEGTEKLHYLCPENLKPAHEWLSRYEHFWDTKLQQLKVSIEGSSDE